MKKITIKKVKEVLAQLYADPSTTELIMNNVILYNDLVDTYNSGKKTNQYLMYQLNNQIIKQIENVKKLNIKLSSTSIDEDDFTQMINNLKGENKPAPIGYLQNKKDNFETR